VDPAEEDELDDFEELSPPDELDEPELLDPELLDSELLDDEPESLEPEVELLASVLLDPDRLSVR
jgi:hypothetical protein